MKILLAVDDSPCAAAAVQATAMYPPMANQVHVLHVVEWPMRLPVSFAFAEGASAARAILDVRRRMVARGEELVTRAADTLRREGFEPTTSVLVGNAGPTILDYAADWDADLVILGTHGRHGVERLVFGSVAEAVVRQAGCPVETVCWPAA
jgi:nucleotide-binding universal stress UspA family protein